MRRRVVLSPGGPPGSIMVIALLLMALLSLLGMTLLTVAGLGHSTAFNAIWSEGALFAADAGIQTGINQLSPNPATSTQAIPNDGTPSVSIGTGTYTFAFRSGRRTDAGPQPLQFMGTRVEPGYSLAIGSGYNPAGYAFHSYQITATGTGPRSAQREIEARAEYGPIAQ